MRRRWHETTGARGSGDVEADRRAIGDRRWAIGDVRWAIRTRRRAATAGANVTFGSSPEPKSTSLWRWGVADPLNVGFGSPPEPNPTKLCELAVKGSTSITQHRIRPRSAGVNHAESGYGRPVSESVAQPREVGEVSIYATGSFENDGSVGVPN